jgi:hypothetical protein
MRLREFFELQPKFEPEAIARNAMKYSWRNGMQTPEIALPVMAGTAPATRLKRVLLISNKVFHYRASNYNYFCQAFSRGGLGVFRQG